jgi:polyketide synthase PksN
MKENSLRQIVVDSVSRHPDKIAIKIKDEVLTYYELFSKATQVANFLNVQGVHQEAVGIVGQRHMDSYVGVLGILLSGCYYVPINPKLSKDKIISIINDSKIRFLVGDVGNFSKIEKYIESSKCSQINKKIIPSKLEQLSGEKIDISSNNVEQSELAYVLYTSGSTGKPKGVKVTNNNVVAFLKNMQSIYPMKAGFRASQMFDFSFDPSVSDIFFTWSMGGILCVPLEEEVMPPYDFIKREKISYWNSVPSIIGFMEKMGYLSSGVFPHIEYSMFCGEQFPKHYADAWRIAAPNSTVENLYGPTESTIYTSRYLYSKDQEGESFRNDIVPIGESLPSMTIEIIDENSNRVGVGEIGEIVYKGPQITKGYLGDDEKTTSVFVQLDWDESGDTWYKSGDLGFLNDKGNFECIGRKDNQIKLGGRRIEIGEIESVLSKFAHLQDIVIVSIKDGNEITTGCAAFTMSEISKEEEMCIRKDSRDGLEQVFFPKRIITLDEFPRLPSGKIDRKELLLRARSL